eukprot:9006646-Alexandrium_andersonii.AAC.1
MVDFTVYVGDASLGHGAARTTMAVERKLDEFPVELGREGSIGKHLKGVHWVMLAIVWWRKD